MTYIRKLLSSLTLLALLAAPAAAEDIDLFLVSESAGGAIPNVLFIIDNSANWNSQLGSLGSKEAVEKAALKAVLTDPGLIGKIRVGIMLFSPENPRGGYVYSRVRLLDEAYQLELADKIANMPQANNAPYALAVHEAYRYYKGDIVRVGLPSDHDPGAVSGGAYVSPITAACQKNFIIFIGNGAPDSSENNPALAELEALGGNTHQIPLNPGNYEGNWMDEHARFLAGVNLSGDEFSPQNIVTHTVAVYDKDADSQNTTPLKAARALLKSAATVGHGQYFPVHNTDGLAEVLKTIMDAIQAVDSVFASTSLPVSVNVRGTHLNQVYMGVFRPDPQKRPRWYGNLKLYQMGRDPSTGEVFLADANGNRAQSLATGFIVHNAESFWTVGSSYWSFDPRGTPLSGSDLPDGAVVEKGGVAQQLRQFTGGPGIRKVYTCTDACGPTSPLANTPFATTNTTGITAAALGVATTTERDALIEWVRGTDNKDDENADGSYADMRASVHGDVLHSRPAVLNYNSTGLTDEDVVVFYGSNDGMFRAVRGGMGTEGGKELWSFVLPEFFERLRILQDNASAADTAVGWKPYFVDGSIGVHREMVGDSIANAYLYLSMRRGGRFIYALDVSDPTNPKLLWRRSHEDAGWAELGQTWSEPTVAHIRAHDGPVLIFGAGYDAEAEDVHPAGTRSMGRGIFVVDAMTGNILWQAGPAPTTTPSKTVADMLYSIPSDISIIDTQGDRLGDRLYVGDTGGNVWRIDIQSPTFDEWQVHKLVSVGGGRKFLYPPDVVLGDDGTAFYGIVLGSGDREKPFNTAVEDHLYMLKDREAFTGLIPALLDITLEPAVPGPEYEGWYLRLAPGEKTVTSALTLNNVVTFATNQPAPPDTSTCSNLGIARIYTIDFRDGGGRQLDGGRSQTVPGGGLPPSPVYFITPIDGQLEEGAMLGPTVTPSQSEPLRRRTRTYWYSEHEDPDGS